MLAALHRVQVLCRPKTTPAHLSFPDRIGLAISSISMPSTRRSTRSASAATPKADVEKAAESGSTGAATLSGRKRARKQETQDEVAVDVKEAGPPAKKGRNAVKQGRGPKSTAAAKTKEGSPVPTENAGPRYWLYKSEPESRITESGHDVKFSIDDLVSRPNQTEPWDGVRNFAARNNLKAMRLGDRGFFYHSNCKEPGIVGIVEVVKEAVPDGMSRMRRNYTLANISQNKLSIQRPTIMTPNRQGRIQSGFRWK